MAKQRVRQEVYSVNLPPRRRLWGVVGLFVCVLALPVRAAADQPNPDLLARGKYLATVGDCAACHTADGGQAFAGGLMLATPFGPISTPNITPDKQTGIGTWTDDDFYRALHTGIGKDGEHLYPAMPFPWYTKVTRDDVLAIKAYLFSLSPVNAPRKPSRLEFPFNIRAGLAAWDELFLREGTFKPDPGKSAEVNRGAYIVEGLGHCGACHNGNNLLGDTTMARGLQGGLITDWYAPNITSDVHDGVGKYSDDQLVTYLKTGVAPGMGVAAGPMAQTIHDSLGHLTDADLHAIVAYLKSTPAVASYASTHETGFTGPDPIGRSVYLNDCASCHQPNGEGIKDSVPSLVGSVSVLARGSEDVMRVVLGGIEARESYAPMPAIGVSMTDQQVAEVTNYIRQAWGNAAPPNAGPGMVGTLRKSTFTEMTIGPDGHCAAGDPSGIAAALGDPKTGITDTLRSVTLANMLQSIEQILPKVKAAEPQAKQADIVNGLTALYCPIVEHDPNVPDNLKVPQLDHFSDRVYSELKTNGHE